MEVVLSGKGQLVIPARLRRRLGLKKGSRVFIEEEEGIIKLVPRTSVRDLAGCWKSLNLDLQEIRREIERDRDTDR
jgi:AbrB family looped-hinge helix DNA binding protein